MPYVAFFETTEIASARTIGGGSYRAHLVLATATSRAAKLLEEDVARTGHDPSRTFIRNLGHAVAYGLVDNLGENIETGRIVYG